MVKCKCYFCEKEESKGYQINDYDFGSVIGKLKICMNCKGNYDILLMDNVWKEHNDFKRLRKEFIDYITRSLMMLKLRQ